jgi:DNA-directed RNA polymerase specialized sigma24 family protein
MTMTYALPITRRAGRNRHAVPALWRQVVRGAAKDEQVEPDRSAHTQLEIYEGVLTAFERRTEVMRTIEGASDRLTAVLRIRQLLGVSQLQATAILELRGQGFSTASRDRVAHRAAELRASLAR